MIRAATQSVVSAPGQIDRTAGSPHPRSGSAVRTARTRRSPGRSIASVGRPETGPSGKGFLADVCRQWEAATAPAEAAGIRVAHLRTGIVLSGKGGALAKQVPIFKAFLGAPLGTGRQWTSWISLRDELAAIRHCLVADVRGPVNLVGPAPVTNRDFTKALGRALHRPTLPVPVPAFVWCARPASVCAIKPPWPRSAITT